MATYVVGELQVDARFQGGRISKNGDLTVDINGFFFDISGTKGRYAGGVNLPVVDNSTNYCYFDETQTLVINQTGWPTIDHIRLGRIISSGGTILSIADERAFLSGIGASTLVPHKNTHMSGGSDEVGSVLPTPYGIPYAGSNGELDPGWIPPPAIAQYVTVAKSGGDFVSIADAINSVTDATATKQYSVIVHPGTYIEAPFFMKPYVSVSGSGSPLDAVVKTNDNNAHFITGAAGSFLSNLSVEGPTGAGNAAIYHTELSNTPFFLQHIIIRAGDYGVFVSGAGAPSPHALVHMIAVGNQYIGSAISRFVYGTGNSYVAAALSGATSGGPLGPDYGFFADGANVKIRLDSCSHDVGGSAGLYIDNGASLRATGGTINDATIGVHVGPSGVSDVDLVGVALRDGLTEAIKKEGSLSYVRFSGSADRSKMPTINGPERFIGSFISSSISESSQSVIGEFTVGNEKIPKESCFGGGDSHTRGMVVLTNTNLEAGIWNDITVELTEKDGTDVALFAGTNAGQTVYIGGDQHFPGLKYACTQALNIGTGMMVSEYWNGAAWVPFYILATDASAPYGAYAQTPMMRVNTEQIRFDFMSGHALKTLNGISKYWARYRITSDIIAAPRVDRFKLHTHRTEINADGMVEYFGNAEPLRLLISHKRLVERDDNFQPNKVIVNYGTDAGAGPVITRPRDNEFTDGQISGLGGEVFVPHGLNTAKEIYFDIGFYPDTAVNGDIEFSLTYGGIKNGGLLDGTHVSEISRIIVPVLASESMAYRKVTIPVRMSDMLPGEFLYFGLKRDATVGNVNDTYAGGAVVLAIDISGYFWR